MKQHVIVCSPNALSPLNKLESLIAPLPTFILMVNFFVCTKLLSSLRANCKRTLPVDEAKIR